jgi:tetratricopeptide (TPR) repeat protein
VRILKHGAAVTIVVATLLLIRDVAVEPYRANVLKKSIERQFDRLYAEMRRKTPSLRALEDARENIAHIRSAMKFVPTDVDLHLELAAHYGIIGDQLETQIAIYNELLKFHRRPEIFLNLGNAEFESGRHRQAIDHFAWAAAFDYLYIHSVPEALKEEVTRKAYERRAQLAARLIRR